ncbi:MAG: LPS export ABC transporter permease LptG [Gammaproteobacteria bacterium]|nr:MAG: LPS export ABC transporter permease LptG [Gammaproteobacteria bacterium]
MIVDRYLGRTVASASALALGLLIAIDLFFALVQELQDIGQGGYRLATALAYLALTVPRRVVRLFPMAVLLGTLLGLGHLAAANELTALRTSGMSRLRIMLGVLRTVFVLVLAVLALQEWVAPASSTLAQQVRRGPGPARVALQPQGGFWIRDGKRFLHLQAVTPEGPILGITVHELSDSVRIRRTVRAARAVPLDGQGWELQDITETRYTDGRLEIRHRARERWPTLIDPQLLEVLARRPEQLSNRELARYIAYMRANGLDASRYALVYWHRWLTPLTSLVMVFVAMPFVFATQRIAGQGVRVVIGILVGLGFYLVDQMLSHMGQVFGLPPLLGTLAPSLLFLLVAGIALVRTERAG